MFISSLYVMTCHAICVVAAVVGIFGCNQCSSIFSQSRPTHLAGYEFVRRRIIIRRHGR